MNYDIVIFDFDGTIAETGLGITNCVAYALEKMGRPALDLETRKKFIGPPLHDSFMRYCGMTDGEAEQAIALYRERYKPIGLFESSIYAGLHPLLKTLKENGAWVAIASGKPEAFLRCLIDRFGMSGLFDGVAGPDPTNHSADKTAQLRAVLPENADLSRACMVGDRCFDVDAGKKLGMHTVAVEYGYGSREEFEQSGADYIAGTVSDLAKHLLGDTPISRGKMISFEGTDGCGKSTQMKKLREHLEKCGWEVVSTREPGGCPIGEKIRELLLSLDSKGMSAECEALLYAASRVEHVKSVILPALEKGKIVLCDRFLDSSIAYQAFGRELGEDFIRQINSKASELVTPDRTLQFDIDRAAAKARMAQGAPLDRLEIEKEDFFSRVSRGYDAVAAADPGRIVRIDSGRSIEEVFADVLSAVQTD